MLVLRKLGSEPCGYREEELSRLRDQQARVCLATSRSGKEGCLCPWGQGRPGAGHRGL